MAKRNPLWDTLVFLFGEPNEFQTALYGKVVRALDQSGATPEGMIESARGIAAEWGRKALTPTSLAKWYTRYSSAVGQLPSDPEEVQMALRFLELQAQYEREEQERESRRLAKGGPGGHRPLGRGSEVEEG